MKKFLASVFLPVTIIALSASANADTRIMEVWMCTLNDGHTMVEARASNSNWISYVKRSVPDASIQSYVTTPVVGAQEGFMFVDSYPSMEVWTRAKSALRKEEGLAVEAALNEVVTCHSNSLYEREES